MLSPPFMDAIAVIVTIKLGNHVPAFLHALFHLILPAIWGCDSWKIRCQLFWLQCLNSYSNISFSFFFFKILFIFRQRGMEGEKERGTSVSGCLSCAPYWEPGPQPRHVPWSGNQTCDPLVRRPLLNPLSLTSHGVMSVFLKTLPGVFNQWPMGHMQPRMPMNAAQHKIVNLLKSFYLLISFC